VNASRSALEWLGLQVETLYVSDDLGRLRFVRGSGIEESELEAAPRIWMGRTGLGNLWRFGADLPADVMLELDSLCRTEPVVTEFESEPTKRTAIRTAIRTVLEQHAPISAQWRGPAYQIPESVDAPANGVIVTEANADVLERYFAWKLTSKNSFKSSALAATVVEGDAVAICCCARLTARAAEAGVETVAAARGRGYAVVAVSAWAAAIRMSGLEPLYSTSWENVASQCVARKVGAVQYAKRLVDHVTRGTRQSSTVRVSTHHEPDCGLNSTRSRLENLSHVRISDSPRQLSR
jgi:RimJ/RimL family protein N-acetyltransferase